jgi:hypothetical protein
VHRGIEGLAVKLEENKGPAGNEGARGATGATRAVPADELDPGRERRPLESYFQEIGGTRTLRREEEVLLAKELEAATLELREALYAIPLCARHVVQRWDELRALSHTGAKLSESAGDEETGEIALRVEHAVKRLRSLLAQRDKAREAGKPKDLKRIDGRVMREMKSAQLSLAVLAEMRQHVLDLAAALRRARRGTRKFRDLEIRA